MSKAKDPRELIDRYLQAVRFWLPKSRKQEELIAELGEDLRSQVEEKEAEISRAINDAEVSEILKRCGAPMGHPGLSIGQYVGIALLDIVGSLPFGAIGLFIGTRASSKSAPAFANLAYLPFMILSKGGKVKADEDAPPLPANGEIVIPPYEPQRYPLGLGASLIAGALSGLLGIGGGPIKVPVMFIFMRELVTQLELDRFMWKSYSSRSPR